MDRITELFNQIVRLLNGWLGGGLGAVFSRLSYAEAVFILFFLLASFLFSLVLKKRRVIIFSLSVYVVTALYQALPFDWGLRFGNNVWIFLGAVAAVFLLLRSTIASSFYGGGDYSGRIKLFLLSAIAIGFLISSALNFVTDVDILEKIGLVDKMFSGDASRGIWAILPLAGFLFLRK